MPSVFIVGPDSSVERTFKARGWDVERDIDYADLVILTGGSDINPALYGENPHPFTYFNLSRDEKEIEVYNYCVEKSINIAGICRGGQLMSVLNGSRMLQHVDNHNVREHQIVDFETKKVYWVNSVHHQMMVPGDGAELIAAAIGQATSKETVDSNGKPLAVFDDGLDPEVLVYRLPNINLLCFQAHPEYGHKETTDYFFELVERVYGLTADVGYFEMPNS